MVKIFRFQILPLWGYGDIRASSAWKLRMRKFLSSLENLENLQTIFDEVACSDCFTGRCIEHMSYAVLHNNKAGGSCTSIARQRPHLTQPLQPFRLLQISRRSGYLASLRPCWADSQNRKEPGPCPQRPTHFRWQSPTAIGR